MQEIDPPTGTAVANDMLRYATEKSQENDQRSTDQSTANALTYTYPHLKLSTSSTAAAPHSLLKAYVHKDIARLAPDERANEYLSLHENALGAKTEG